MSHPFQNNYALVNCLLLPLTGCFHSTRYVATYTVENQSTLRETTETAIILLFDLSVQYALSADPKYSGTDTLGFSGQPYHYLICTFAPGEKQTMIKVDYWAIHSGKKSPYDQLFHEISDSIQSNFVVVDQTIHKHTTQKEKGKFTAR